MVNNFNVRNSFETDEERLEKEQLRRQKTALVDRFLVLNQNDLPDDKIPMLRENMLHCSLRKLGEIQSLTCRRVENMQFISFILGWSGIDRMLIGEIGIGLLKLCTGGCFGFLMVYDWLAMPRKTRYYNYIEVMSVLDYDDYEYNG
ncbi:MAG: TM2 domain-containing protein [Clostridia bacterium]|jgi:TM2 domain-containing membrane protein YozV|nr:TM2 domain-containing protein [Clostridia bacterium]